MSCLYEGWSTYVLMQVRIPGGRASRLRGRNDDLWGAPIALCLCVFSRVVLMHEYSIMHGYTYCTLSCTY